MDVRNIEQFVSPLNTFYDNLKTCNKCEVTTCDRYTVLTARLHIGSTIHLCQYVNS